MLRPDIPVQVMKFGGTSVVRMQEVAELVVGQNEEMSSVVVVSALVRVTDELHEMVNGSGLNRREDMFGQLQQRHLDMARDLRVDEQQIGSLLCRLEVDLSKINGSVSLQDRDRIVTFGERLSACLLVGAIRNLGQDSEFVDPGRILVATREFGNATVIEERSRFKVNNVLRSLIQDRKISVVPGYYGVTEGEEDGFGDGEIATFGRGGSDYSAAWLANLLGANRVIYWKEVDGVFDEDPLVNPDATLYKFLTYEEARKLVEGGAEVLHPETMEPLKAREIPAFVKNTFKPDLSGTRIGVARESFN